MEEKLPPLRDQIVQSWLDGKVNTYVKFGFNVTKIITNREVWPKKISLSLRNGVWECN